jgi:hypothetical protein
MATFFDEKSIHSKKYASNEKEKRKRVSVGDERVFKSIGPRRTDGPSGKGARPPLAPEQSKQNNDRKRDTQYPEQRAFSKSHDVLLFRGQPCREQFVPFRLVSTSKWEAERWP